MNPQDVVELKNALAGMAEILHEYLEHLVEQGFTRQEAMRIVIGYQHVTFGGSSMEKDS